MKKGAALPAVEVTWYDGGLQPMKPEGWPAGKSMNVQGGGVIFHGTKDKLICGCYGAQPWLLSGRVPEAPKFRRRIEGQERTPAGLGTRMQGESGNPR
jgi:hypothetical protein